MQVADEHASSRRTRLFYLHPANNTNKQYANPYKIHFREPNRFPISRSRNRSVLSVLEYRPNGSTEPIGNPERVGPNRPKHAIYRFGSNRESVLDRPNASSGCHTYILWNYDTRMGRVQ